MKKFLPILALGVHLTGCATILSGTDQDITVMTNPSGAACDFIRTGTSIGTVASTPATMNVRKTKDDIRLVCRKPGYVDTEAVLPSGVDSRSYANMFLGIWGLVPLGFDSLMGADNSYPESPTLTLASEESKVAKLEKK